MPSSEREAFGASELPGIQPPQDALSLGAELRRMEKVLASRTRKTLRERLLEERADLVDGITERQDRLARVNAALAALDAYPDVAEAFDRLTL